MKRLRTIVLHSSSRRRERSSFTPNFSIGGDSNWKGSHDEFSLRKPVANLGIVRVLVERPSHGCVRLVPFSENERLLFLVVKTGC